MPKIDYIAAALAADALVRTGIVGTCAGLQVMRLLQPMNGPLERQKKVGGTVRGTDLSPA